jgi:hypothetical protein
MLLKEKKHRLQFKLSLHINNWNIELEPTNIFPELGREGLVLRKFYNSIPFSIWETFCSLLSVYPW